MIELYDDCNFKNKPVIIQIGSSWYHLSAMEYERRAMRELFNEVMNRGLWYDGPGAQFAQMQDELCTCTKPVL